MTSCGGTEDDVAAGPHQRLNAVGCMHISEEYAVNKWNQALPLLFRLTGIS